MSASTMLSSVSRERACLIMFYYLFFCEIKTLVNFDIHFFKMSFCAN